MFNEVTKFVEEHKQRAVRIGVAVLVAWCAEKVLENGITVPNFLSGGDSYAIGFPGYEGLYTLHAATTGPCETKHLTHQDGSPWNTDMRDSTLTDVSLTTSGVSVQTRTGVTVCQY